MEMIFETFQHVCIAAIGMLEAERDTNLDFTNQNGVEFAVRQTKVAGVFGFGIMMSYGDKAYIEYFLKSTTPEKITAKHIIDAAIAMADWVEENKYIDQFDLIELKNRHHDNS